MEYPREVQSSALSAARNNFAMAEAVGKRRDFHRMHETVVTLDQQIDAAVTDCDEAIAV